MGAQESTGRSDQENADGTGTTFIDYYQLLEVTEDATVEEVRVSASLKIHWYRSKLTNLQKRSFRRLALIHHPDKNHTDIEGATRKFAALQQAYEVRPSLTAH